MEKIKKVGSTIFTTIAALSFSYILIKGMYALVILIILGGNTL